MVLALIRPEQQERDFIECDEPEKIRNYLSEGYKPLSLPEIINRMHNVVEIESSPMTDTHLFFYETSNGTNLLITHNTSFEFREMNLEELEEKLKLNRRLNKREISKLFPDVSSSLDNNSHLQGEWGEYISFPTSIVEGIFDSSYVRQISLPGETNQFLTALFGDLAIYTGQFYVAGGSAVERFMSRSGIFNVQTGRFPYGENCGKEFVCLNDFSLSLTLDRVGKGTRLLQNPTRD